jgi:hypothetical protein
MTSLISVVRRAILPAYPTIYSRAKHIGSITGGVMDLTKGYADDVAYLVRQGQQEVIEEDGGDRG